jgi:preprotein translocase subunit YajC
MKIHPLHTLGFEPVAEATPEPNKPVTVTVGMPIEQKPAPQKDSQAAVIVKGAVVKGAKVRLADGTVGKVVYVDQQMRIVRIRTADGKNVTVRRKDLPL